ncbi:MAG: hypothetical protein Q9162_007586 [Coniocarpon cinnabarinum]
MVARRLACHSDSEGFKEDETISDIDIIGQPPKLGIYTQISLLFAVSDASTRSEVIDKVRKGLRVLSNGFPWLAGQVINESATEGDSGVFKIKASESIPQMMVNDLRDEPSATSFAAMKASDFPVSMLDENFIAPCKTLPMLGDNKLGRETSPVFPIQINIINGGIIITFNAQHQAVDMTGLFQAVRLLSKACRDEPFTDEELRIGNLPRNNIIPQLDMSAFGDMLKQRDTATVSSPGPSQESTNRRSAPTSSSTWTTFILSSSAQAKLKSFVDSSIPENTSVSFISTDDALSVFTWQCITRARSHRLQTTDTTTLGRAVDPRRYLNISSSYPGMLANKVFHTMKIHELLDSPSGAVAAKLRYTVDPKTSTMGQNTRNLATMLTQAPDKNAVKMGTPTNASTDVTLSSWAQMPIHELDFGPGLGKPEAVRRPRFEAFEGLVYFLPKTADGEVAILLCLRDEDLQHLRKDNQWREYAREIG